MLESMNDFLRYAALAADAHTPKHTVEGAKAYRWCLVPGMEREGEKLPYVTHCLWQAMMVLLEPGLPEDFRVAAAYAFLFHDVLEDTDASLPDDLPELSRHLVHEMTFMGGFAEEKLVVPLRDIRVQLMKLYDKTATLYDGDLPPRLYREWTDYVELLAGNVEASYGPLGIVLLARGLVAKYRALDATA